MGTQVDFTDLHAWAEVFIPGAGWIGLDATSGLLCGEGHMPLAATPHYAPPRRSPASPAARRQTSISRCVTRVAQVDAITRPFEDEGWAALEALGDIVEADLA